MTTRSALPAAVLAATLAAAVYAGQTAPPAPATIPAAQVPDDMARYYVVFLRRGPAWTAASTPESRAISDGHMANIQRLTREGKMVVAGPFEGQSGERALAGIFILRAGSMEEATALVQTDPAVRAGRFVYEIAPWWGPKSLRY